MKTAVRNQQGTHRMIIKKTRFVFAVLAGILTMISCSENDADQSSSIINTVTGQVVNNNTGSETAKTPAKTTEFAIANKRYFFDVTDHSVEELQALLERIEEITEASPETFDELKIVMILHGPDIGLFTQSNYEQNQKLIDLAAKLDAFNVVDMKVCETAMNSLGVKQSEIPPFIESVPYAPAEITRLQREGYISL